MLTRLERGWCGHFICGDRCRFRRNTLVSDGTNHIIISSVGNMWYDDKMQTIGYKRYYETMIFIGKQDGEYIDASVGEGEYTNFVLDGDWCVIAENVDELPDDVDNVANEIHERAVLKVQERFADIIKESQKKGD